MIYPWPASDVTSMDGFCGAGGSSQGIEAAGVRVVLAMNHNEKSLATHAHNFPQARHAQVDISKEDPRKYPPTTMAWFSPECRYHSTSKGKRLLGQNQLALPGMPITDGEEDPFQERSRMTMWDVVRWSAARKEQGFPFQLVFVENITKIPLWGGYQAWLKAMLDLDYAYETVYFNSMFAPGFPRPVAQSRDRWYTVFWRKGNQAPDLKFTPPAFCQYCEQRIGAIQCWKKPTRARGDYKRQYVYRCPRCIREAVPAYAPAMSVINWSLPMSIIGERMEQRKRPLKAKTLKRIALGLERFCRGPQATPFLVETTRTMTDGGFARAVTDAHFTQTTAQSVGLAVPFVVDLSRTHATNDHGYAYSVERALPTMTTQQDKALVVPQETQPFLMSYYGSSASYKTMQQAMGTITSRDRHALIQPGPVPTVEACQFRMLKLPEIKAAMGFPDDYTIVCTSQREGVRQCGLAVTPAVATMLVQRGLQSLGYQVPQ